MLYSEETPLSEMIADALATFPDECCGFIFGNETGDRRTITKTIKVNNAMEGDKRRRFEITPKDYMYAEKFAEKNNLLLLGVYHSHPNHPAFPSETDRAAAQPYFSYIIISVMNKEFAGLRSWRLNDHSQFEEESIQQHTFTNQT